MCILLTSNTLIQILTLTHLIFLFVTTFLFSRYFTSLLILFSRVLLLVSLLLLPNAMLHMRDSVIYPYLVHGIPVPCSLDLCTRRSLYSGRVDDLNGRITLVSIDQGRPQKIIITIIIICKCTSFFTRVYTWFEYFHLFSLAACHAGSNACLCGVYATSNYAIPTIVQYLVWLSESRNTSFRRPCWMPTYLMGCHISIIIGNVM